MDEKLKAKTIGDDELDEVAGGYNGDYAEIYKILKNNGIVSGNPRNFKQITSDAEKEKVENALGDILGGSVEIGQFADKENVYWVNSKVMQQKDVVAAVKDHYKPKMSIIQGSNTLR